MGRIHTQSYGGAATASTLTMDSDISNPFGYGFKGEGFRVLDSGGISALTVDSSRVVTIPVMTHTDFDSIKVSDVIIEDAVVRAAVITPKRIDKSDTVIGSLAGLPKTYIAQQLTETEIARFTLSNLVSTTLNQSIRLKIGLYCAAGIGCNFQINIYLNNSLVGSACCSTSSGQTLVTSLDVTLSPGDVIKAAYIKQATAAYSVILNQFDICGTLTDITATENYPVEVTWL